jgi:hypothetical protein
MLINIHHSSSVPCSGASYPIYLTLLTKGLRSKLVEMFFIFSDWKVSIPYNYISMFIQEIFLFINAFGHRLNEDTVTCDGCNRQVPIRAQRYRCMECQDLDLCETCFSCKWLQVGDSTIKISETIKQAGWQHDDSGSHISLKSYLTALKSNSAISIKFQKRVIKTLHGS